MKKIISFFCFFILYINFSFCATTNMYSASLSWNSSPDNYTVGYKIYYGLSPTNFTNVINVKNVTNTTIYNLLNGNKYFFSATSYDIVGLESLFSNEVNYSIPVVSLTAFISKSNNLVYITSNCSTNFNVLYSHNLINWSYLSSTNRGGFIKDVFSITNTFYKIRTTLQ